MLFCFSSPGYCAHEFIVDAKDFKKYGIEAIDIAKRLQDYGERKCSCRLGENISLVTAVEQLIAVPGAGKPIACFNCGQTSTEPVPSAEY